MIKAIIFDFFGVLVTEGFKLFCDTYFSEDKKKRARALGLVRQHDAGLISKQDYITELASLARVGEAEVLNHIDSNQPNRQLLDYIKTNLKPSYKIGILSNSGDDYVGKMLSPADVALFDSIILSYEYGMTKPDKRIFELSIKNLGVEPENAVFIDDSPTHCNGAAGIGITSILYKDFPQMKQDLERILVANAKN